ncbi:unnamed protein product [Oncorhynchus mykiss]|uniref:Glia maturation factor beta n=1 Tax=Oncorhynchus mykiss TaxID=8022 RepID=A0A060YEW1_ONCMY|nr:unnamed protein product [Oncorhynchus mykiss]
MSKNSTSTSMIVTRLCGGEKKYCSALPSSGLDRSIESALQGKMSESLVVCDVDGDLVKKLREFRFRKETNNAAIIMKIDKDKQLVILDEEHEDISPDDLKDELPERQPRYPLIYTEQKNMNANI